jgi:hypothetical protein
MSEQEQKPQQGTTGHLVGAGITTISNTTNQWTVTRYDSL